MTILIRLILIVAVLAAVLLAVQGLRESDRGRLKLGIAVLVAVILGIGALFWLETTHRVESLPATPALKQLRADAEATLDQVQPTSFDNVKTCLGYLDALNGFYAEHSDRFAAELAKGNTLRDRYRSLTPQQANRFCSDETELYKFLRAGQSQLTQLVVRS
jgi:4-amino-4-deoxy-L-arabinose transferase-like glycosyltransferase